MASQDHGRHAAPMNLDVMFGPVGPGATARTHSTTQTFDRTEWRIRYRRKRGGAGEFSRTASVPVTSDNVTPTAGERMASDEP